MAYVLRPVANLYILGLVTGLIFKTYIAAVYLYITHEGGLQIHSFYLSGTQALNSKIRNRPEYSPFAVRS